MLQDRNQCILTLRGFVRCGDCGNPMTACWSKGSTKRYPYYLCDTRGCPSSRKSVSRDAIEGDFESILKSLQPTKGLMTEARAMIHDAWKIRHKAFDDQHKAATIEIKAVE